MSVQISNFLNFQLRFYYVVVVLNHAYLALSVAVPITSVLAIVEELYSSEYPPVNIA